MGLLRMFTGELSLSPTQKRVRKERTGYGSDIEKLFRRTLNKVLTERVFNPDAPTVFGRVNTELKKGSIVIYSNDLDKSINPDNYSIVVISSDGTPEGHNAEITQVRRINPQARRITLNMPLLKEHSDSEVLGLYPFEDKLLLKSA